MGKRIFKILKYGFLGIFGIVWVGAIFTGVVWAHKKILNIAISDDITWEAYLYIAVVLNTIAWVGCIIYGVVKKEYGEILSYCLCSPLVVFIVFSVFAGLLSTITMTSWDVGYGEESVGAILESGWYNPLVWGKCWWKQITTMGWVRLTFTIAIVGGLECLMLFLAKNFFVIDWYTGIENLFFALIVVVNMMILLWLAPFIISALELLMTGILKFVLTIFSVIYVVDGYVEY